MSDVGPHKILIFGAFDLKNLAKKFETEKKKKEERKKKELKFLVKT